MKKTTDSKKKKREWRKEPRRHKREKGFDPKTIQDAERGHKQPPGVEVPKDILKQYPPPKDNPTFVYQWNSNIAGIVGRDNFKPGHLEQLRLLCDLYVEYENLEFLVKKHGYTYLSVGRNGDQIKMRPEPLQMNRVRSEIRNYSKILGLLLVKDSDFGLGKGGSKPGGNPEGDESEDGW